MKLIFSPEQAEFLRTEIQASYKPDTSYELSSDEIEALLESCRDIEVDEASAIMEETDDISDRGRIAADICDLICHPVK